MPEYFVTSNPTCATARASHHQGHRFPEHATLPPADRDACRVVDRSKAHAATRESEISPCQSLRKPNCHGRDRTTCALTSDAWRRPPQPITLGNRIPAGMTSVAMIALAVKHRRTGFTYTIRSDGRPAHRSRSSCSDYRLAIVFEFSGH